MHGIGHGERLALKDPAGYGKAQRHIAKMNQFHSAPKKDASAWGAESAPL